MAAGRKLTAAEMVELFRMAAGIATFPVPDPHLVRPRVAELAAMGLADESPFEGIASSVRQYAWATLRREAEGDDKRRAFGTFHPGLLARAQELGRRYGVLPVPGPRSEAELRQLMSRTRVELADAGLPGAPQ